MAKVIRVANEGTNEPQEIAGLGVFPRRLADDGRTEKEWRQLIKDGVPLEIGEAREGELDVADAAVPDPRRNSSTVDDQATGALVPGDETAAQPAPREMGGDE